MAGRRMQIFMSGVLLTLVLMRPNIPVLAGVGLLALVVIGAARDMSEPSAKRRWAAFKRMVATSAVGLVLVAAGLAIGGDSLPMQATTAGEARQALGFLAAYALAIIAAPVAAWYHISMREPRRVARRTRSSRTVRTQPTLRRLAAVETTCRARVAV